MAKTDAPDNPLALSAETQEKKRESAKERQEERREQGLVRSFDRDDENVGWDAQQGVLPRDNEDSIQKRLYADDPVKFAPEQLPNPAVLRDAGFDPVISRTQVAEDREDATLQDGGPQTGNVVDEEARELTEPEGPDAPRTVEDANKAKNEAEKKSNSDSSKRTKKKSSSKKS